MRTFPAGAELMNPYPFFAEMRQHHPVAFDEQTGMWSVYRHADVTSALTDHSFANTRTGAVPEASERRFASLVAFDPPRHTQLHKLVSRAFTYRSSGWKRAPRWRPCRATSCTAW